MVIGTYTTTNGVFSVMDNDEHIAYWLKQGVAWEGCLVDFITSLLKKDMNTLDVGAHIGTHSVPYSRHSNHVYSFEMQKTVYDLLSRNLEQNTCINVTTFNNAVGHESRDISISDVLTDGVSTGKNLEYESDVPMNIAGLQLGSGSNVAKMITIDSLDLTNVRFMKVDVEGAEPLVFYGARETIKREKPIIVFERNHKVLSKDFLESMNIPEEVYNFSIEDYAVANGYYPVYNFNDNDYMLFPRIEEMEKRILSLPLFEMKDGSIRSGNMYVYPIGDNKVRFMNGISWNDVTL